MSRKDELKTSPNLDAFPFDQQILSCRNVGIFPDLAIRINAGDIDFHGGELIELKDSQSYSIASFNSTIPTGKKQITSIFTSENANVYRQMQQAGDDILSMPERDVFYLVRGRRRNRSKVCLVHGSFFETISVEQLIQQSFSQVLNDSMAARQMEMTEEESAKLVAIFSHQQSFSRVRDVAKASVKLRFRIMTEAKAEGNLLNPRNYPDILDDTLNFLVPCHGEQEQQVFEARMQRVLETEYTQLKVFILQHLLNGPFLVFQIPL
jgi:hypothetical protein